MRILPLLLALCALPASSTPFNARAEWRIRQPGQRPHHAANRPDALPRGRRRPDGARAELRQGVFMGVVRHFKNGKVQRVQRQRRGNKEGRSREFDGSQLVAEEPTATAARWACRAAGDPTAACGAWASWRRWPPGLAEWTPQGKLSGLRCASEPQLAPHADYRRGCAPGGPGTVTLHAAMAACAAHCSTSAATSQARDVWATASRACRPKPPQAAASIASS